MASNTTAVYAAIFGNLAVAVTKFVAAAISGTSARLTEGIQKQLTSNEIASAIDRTERGIRGTERRVRRICIEADGLAAAGRHQS